MVMVVTMLFVVLFDNTVVATCSSSAKNCGMYVSCCLALSGRGQSLVDGS